MPLRILIVGLGIAGPTLATLLLTHPSQSPSEKPHITILERASSLRGQGQNIDVRTTGLTIIRQLGLEKAVRDSTTGEEGVQLVDERNQVWAEIGADRSGRYEGPTADVEIMRGRLAELLYEMSVGVSDEVKEKGGKGVDYVFGDYVDEVQQDDEQVRVRFHKSGEWQSYDVVVGADGLQSGIRKMVWGSEGEDERVKNLGTYGGFFSMPPGEKDTMWRRWFRAPGGKSIMLRPDVRNKRTTAFLVVINDEDTRLLQVAKEGMRGVEEQKKLLEGYFRGVGWESERILREMRVSKDFYYDMIAQVKMDSWSKGRVVLLGDAGYCASPISGKGTTLALNGAYHLAGALIQNSPTKSSSPAAAFAQYESAMRPIVTDAQKLVPGMPRLMAPQTAWGIWALHTLAWLIIVSGMRNLILRLKGGAPKDEHPVVDYGFEELEEFVVKEWSQG